MLKSFTLFFCILNFFILYKRNRIVSSTSIWLFCYFLIFIIYPLYSGYSSDNSYIIDVWSLVGIIVFCIGNFFGYYFVIKKRKDYSSDDSDFSIPNFKLSFIFFILFFLISLYFLITIVGFNGLQSILEGTLTSKNLNLISYDSDSIVFSMHLLVPCILSMWISSKNGIQKGISVIALFIYIVETLLFGFTRIFLITILAIIFFYEIRKVPRRKQLSILMIGGVSLALLLVFMNYIRCFGVNNDNDFSDYLNIDYIFESTDFGASYIWFDSLLNHESPNISPIVYLKPFFAFVPRTVWPGKPEPLSLQVLKYINPSLASTGYSTAGNSVLGEGYSLFGFFGIIIVCFIWGIVCEKLDTRYYNRLGKNQDSNYLNIFYYIFASFIVISGQRGDWSQYMTIVLWFYYFPIILFAKIRAKISRRRKIYG